MDGDLSGCRREGDEFATKAERSAGRSFQPRRGFRRDSRSIGALPGSFQNIGRGSGDEVLVVSFEVEEVVLSDSAVRFRLSHVEARRFHGLRRSQVFEVRYRVNADLALQRACREHSGKARRPLDVQIPICARADLGYQCGGRYIPAEGAVILSSGGHNGLVGRTPSDGHDTSLMAFEGAVGCDGHVKIPYIDEGCFVIVRGCGNVHRLLRMPGNRFAVEGSIRIAERKRRPLLAQIPNDGGSILRTRGQDVAVPRMERNARDGARGRRLCTCARLMHSRLRWIRQVENVQFSTRTPRGQQCLLEGVEIEGTHGAGVTANACEQRIFLCTPESRRIRDQHE